MKSFWLKLIMVLIAVSLFVSCGGGGGSTEPGGVFGEGTTSNPVALGIVDTTVNHSGSVGADGDSYYSFTTDACGGTYGVSLTNAHSDLGWWLYSKSTYTITDLIDLCDNLYTSGTESCTTPTLTPNTTYYLDVAEYDGVAGTYALNVSAPTALPPAPISPPSGLVVTPGGGKAKITWNSITTGTLPTAYNIYWSLSSGVTTTTGTKIAGIPEGSTTTTYIHIGLTATTYYYIVTGVNVCAEGPASPVSSATVTAAGTPLLTSNFDNNTLQGWTATGSWGVTNSSASNGSYSVTDSPAGNYSNSSDTTLTSPAFDLTGSTLPTLSFSHRGSFGNNGDIATVEVSTNNGTSWSIVKAVYNFSVPSSFTYEAVDLSAYKASQVKIRFTLWTDASIAGDGWYIDDIQVTP